MANKQIKISSPDLTHKFKYETSLKRSVAPEFCTFIQKFPNGDSYFYNNKTHELFVAKRVNGVWNRSKFPKIVRFILKVIISIRRFLDSKFDGWIK